MSLNVLWLCLIVLDIWIRHKITFKLLGDFILNTMTCVLKDVKLISTTHSKEFEWPRRVINIFPILFVFIYKKCFFMFYYSMKFCFLKHIIVCHSFFLSDKWRRNSRAEKKNHILGNLAACTNLDFLKNPVILSLILTSQCH